MLVAPGMYGRLEFTPLWGRMALGVGFGTGHIPFAHAELAPEPMAGEKLVLGAKLVAGAKLEAGATLPAAGTLELGNGVHVTPGCCTVVGAANVVGEL